MVRFGRGGVSLVWFFQLDKGSIKSHGWYRLEDKNKKIYIP